ncbi:RAP1A, member of RAS oncogene family [Planoprotostelium fungivorum]|uniref:RAP1A, member of RAS oncogene family n=1 Tax=Planoprotostelium fungivorum TaxID=1890364 RepID=A0A2P6NJ58_9EUKA|nr:RAP1A, member of RAS oncogene family [Planoprotostelium fungivorum]
MKEIKIAVIGCSGVGKSSITMQFLHNFFLEESDCTLEETYRKQVNLEGEECILEITGIALVYSTISRRSFEAIESYRDAVLKAMLPGTSVPMLLVGNMSDITELREVGKKEGEDLASSWGIPFLECTAKRSEDCIAVFMRLSSATVLSEIPRKISELEKQFSGVKWYKMSAKGKLRKSIKALKNEQSCRETRYELQGLESELTKLNSCDGERKDLSVDPSSLSEDMQRLWLDRDTADVTIMVGSLPFYCHMAVLYLRFPAMFKQILPTCRVYNVPQRVCSSSVVFSVLLRHVYTGEIPEKLHPDLIPTIISTAESLNLAPLADKLRRGSAQTFEPTAIDWDLDRLLQSLNSGANVTVKTTGKIFTLHRSLLQTRIPSYCQMYGVESTITLDVKPEVFSLFVHYVYRDELSASPMSTTTLIELSVLASRHCLRRLSQFCERRIAEEMSQENSNTSRDVILSLYEAGISNASQELRKLVENSAVQSNVWNKLRQSERYKQVVPQNVRAALSVKREEEEARTLQRNTLSKQIQSLRVKTEAVV